MRDQDQSPRSVALAFDVSLGSRRKRIELGAGPAIALGVALAAALVVFPCAAAFFAFRDDMLADLGDRQAQIRYSYEDRLAALRLKLDQATSRQFADQDDVESKLRALVLRQAKLETRAAVVARLVESVAAEDKLAAAPVHSRAAAPPPAASAYAAPSEPRPAAFSGFGKPEPAGMELRLSHEDEGRAARAPKQPADKAATGPAADAGAPLQGRIDRLSAAMDRVEREQTTRVARLVEPMRAAARRLRGAFDAAGLATERFVRKSAPAFVGGPFVPAERRSSDLLFERELIAAQDAAATLDGLRKALPSVPLRKPLAGELELTSSFGYRTDPFFGRPALHTGVDLREDYGAPVRATAAGVVAFAGSSGGYGQMVEIDHGAGLVTRYAHLSSILASVGQPLEAGAVVGRIGSTGRSTGPHLHYEVRIDGEPVDPTRFLRAGAVLAEVR
ncbi:M23 family metallopeptidase [Methylosinus sp. Sm6]|uniref:M23 family metallopeptidase n=1 Tax=Methylosinus sp. Sm6 TaxID=2866948 RepID=UPI001C996109|nr:M23 family metallopeptidase [Methylosinus sp. Sm6]MBY6242666.1 M23 family metallopeptidase [Methylosinus sp. Sm6]